MDIQKAGNNSTQVQASVVNFYNGITEQRAREIYQEESQKIQELTHEASQIAIQRVRELENRVIPKLSQIEKGLDFFSNPDFQFVLLDAQKSAARSDRPVDYDLLSELLIHRVKNDDDKVKRLGIKKAIEIVDSVADEALLGLTVFHSVTTFNPNSGDVEFGLKILDDLFGKIMYDELPQGSHWLDHLDILGAIRMNTVSQMKSFADFYSNKLSGYVCTGIEKSSEDYIKAKKLLDEINISSDILIDNILNPGYVRLPIVSLNNINFISKVIHIPLSEGQNVILKEIVSLYSKKDANLIQQVKHNFFMELEQRPYLKLLKEWWDKIPFGITITEVGKVLAHVNAQRCDKSLPPLN